MALQDDKLGRVAVDASKLSLFLGQIQTIQEKVNTLRKERKASMQRMDAIEVSRRCGMLCHQIVYALSLCVWRQGV